MSIHIEDIDKQVVRSYYTSPKIEESIERLLKADEELIYSETLPGYKIDFVETEDQEPKYCDRDICTSNEYNGVGCNECEVTKSQEKASDFTEEDISGKYYGHEEYILTDEDIEKLKTGKKLFTGINGEYSFSLEYKK